MSTLLVENIGELLLPTDRELAVVNGASVLIVDGKVVFAGLAAQTPTAPHCARLDAEGRLVSPALCDPHAHLVFAGSRAHEFDLRNQGKSYLEIQAAGGGILSTVKATRAASDGELADGLRQRLDRLLLGGVTLAESKSGYDLTPEGELRLLRILSASTHPVSLAPTFLFHVPDPSLAPKQRQPWIDTLLEALTQAAHHKLCHAVDVYCDEGAFTLDETRRILTAGKSLGLLLRVHAEQFTHTGAADLAAELGARSVEHLEQLGPNTPARLAAAGTVCNLLPGAALTLRLPWPDARRMLDAGCRVALGTDCNPGSSLTESQTLMMSLATTMMRMTAAEAWLGVTRHAAHALAADDAGHLAPGARGDVVLWDATDHREIPQHLGASPAHTVVVAGRIVVANHQRVTR